MRDEGTLCGVRDQLCRVRERSKHPDGRGVAPFRWIREVGNAAIKKMMRAV